MDFDFLSSNLQIAYPFKDEVEVTRPSGDVPIDGLAAALRYYTYDQRDADLYIDEVDFRSSDGFATLDSAQVDLRWSDGTTVTLEDGVTAEAKVYTYGAWIVVTLMSLETSGSSSSSSSSSSGVGSELPTVLHIVFPADVVETAGSIKTYRFWKKTDDIEVLASLVKQGPGKLRRLFIKRGDELVQVAGPGEPVLIGKGFNMSIEAQEATLVGGRQIVPITLDAVPGAGAGRYLICQRNAYLRTLTGVPPSEIGAAQLKPEECYWLERSMSEGPTPVAEPRNNITEEGTLAPNELQLHNSCGPCCSCEDYVATYAHLRDIWDRARVASANFYTLRDGYHGLLASFETYVSNLNDLLTLRQFKTDKMVLTLLIRNLTDEEIPAGVTATLTITPPNGIATFIEETGYVNGPNQKGPLPPEPGGSGDQTITFDEPFPAHTATAWLGMWEFSNVSPDDEVEVVAILANGIDASETETLKIE